MTSYKQSGVDIDLADQFVDYLGMHDYGAVVDIGDHKIVLSTDGVGTKLLVAEELNKFDTIGIDLVAMSVNDVLCQGAKPVSFLDYYATGKLNLEKSKVILNGIIEGCKIANCKLVGGETAEMPGMYEGDKFDLAGFCMGVVLKDIPIGCESGDFIVGIPSSGPHSNGFSLIRKLYKDNNKPFDDFLLTPTRIYTKEILENLNWIKACSHITGSGIHGNLPRVLGNKQYELDIEIPKGWWSELFSMSSMSKFEFENVFNCGWGMLIVTETPDRLNIPDKQVIGRII